MSETADRETWPVVGPPAVGRKVRWQDARRGKGERRGLRVIYLYLPEFAVLGLVDVYAKNEVEDLTSSERRILSQLADGFRSDIQERSRKR